MAVKKYYTKEQPQIFHCWYEPEIEGYIMKCMEPEIYTQGDTIEQALIAMGSQVFWHMHFKSKEQR